MIESIQKDLLKDISTWFEILEEISKNTTDTSGLPKLEVSLRSGRMFSGSVTGLQKSTHQNILMLLEQADQQSKARVHLIQCEEVSAVSFVDPTVYLSIFSKPIISELEMKRKVKSVEERIEEATITKIAIDVSHASISEVERNHVVKLAETLPSIFNILMKDNMAKSLILENITSIAIQVGEIAHTSLSNKLLTCVFEKDSDVFLSKQKEDLFLSIEKAL